MKQTTGTQALAVSVHSVSKQFKLPHERYSSLKQSALNLFTPKSFSRLQAVKPLSFEIRKGEFFGIVGRNGSGKSTLLKMLGGIYVPSQGHITVHGSLSPFIELGVGFNPELSARDNVFLNGAILGLSRRQIQEKFDDIIAFAELENFVDQRLKNFSSGMQVRLAFSIAIQAQSDILLIDEVLAVGDAAFQQKCFDVFRRLKRSGKTIVFVTHDMANVTEFCDRVLVINQGESLGIMPPSQAAEVYNRLNLESSLDAQGVQDVKAQAEASPTRWGSQAYQVTNLEFASRAKPQTVLKSGQPLNIKIDVQRNPKVQETTASSLLVGLAFFRSDGLLLAGPNSGMYPIQLPLKRQTVTYHLPKLPLSQGVYDLTVALYGQTPDGETETLDYQDRTHHFAIEGADSQLGAFVLDGDWK